VGNRYGKKEFHNPYSAQLAFADAQNFVVHKPRASPEYEHQLDDE
jgi:hypothetical protein